ncbi:MAG: O-antigen ligase family protein [Gemmatimonadales bacterium]
MKLARGLSVFIWLLPFHVVLIAWLFAGVGLPALTVRAIAAWKELLVAILVGLVALRAGSGRGQRAAIEWLDLAVAGLALIALAYLVGAQYWFGTELPAGARLLGWRDAVFFSLLYFVGRATPEVGHDFRYLRAIAAVGVVTSVIAIVERLLVTPETLVALGAASYIQDFLGLSVTTVHNPYGLPDNYWTVLGDRVVQRAGSTYLSSQGFAVPFLIIVPAATVLAFRAARHRLLAWLAYCTIWAGLLLTVTRMTIVTCVAQLFLTVALLRRWGAGVSAAFAAAVAVGVALLAVPEFAAFLWQTLTWETGSSVAHLEDWGEGFTHLVEQPLGAGIGAGGLTAARFGLTPLAADSQYFKYAVEMGVLGLLLYLAIIAGIIAAAIRALRRTDSEAARAVALVTGVAALGLVLNGATTVPLGTPFFSYVFFWLAGTTVTLAQAGERV